MISPEMIIKAPKMIIKTPKVIIVFFVGYPFPWYPMNLNYMPLRNGLKIGEHFRSLMITKPLNSQIIYCGV